MEKQLSIQSVKLYITMRINELNDMQQHVLISETKYWAKKLDTKEHMSKCLYSYKVQKQSLLKE